MKHLNNTTIQIVLVLLMCLVIQSGKKWILSSALVHFWQSLFLV